uniref:Putative secreted protein n=1 Tax=Anopheles triannulatus TaxID=58253 RepID=A0A2M4B7Y7_9DIPT
MPSLTRIRSFTSSCCLVPADAQYTVNVTNRKSRKHNFLWGRARAECLFSHHTFVARTASSNTMHKHNGNGTNQHT